MHVCVVGAGALGRVYGVRLSTIGVAVSFLVRPQRMLETGPFVLEQVNAGHRRDVLDRPNRVVEVPRDADAVIVTVRFEEIDRLRTGTGGQDLANVLRKVQTAPIVVLTPLLPAQRAALERAIGRSIVSAMPGLAGYIDERDVVRCWITGMASTLIEDAEAPSVRATLDSLAQKLTTAGLAAHLEREVAGLNAASTIALFPFVAAIDAAGWIDRAVSDKELLETVLAAAKEAETLARKVGKPATWSNVLLRFVGPFTLKPSIGLAKRLVPEVVRFVEFHFGPKLHEQHLSMGATILELGKEHGVEMPALGRLMEQLETRKEPIASRRSSMRPPPG